MTMRPVDGTDLRMFPLCLGGNVCGWTVNEQDAFGLLDRFAAGGGNFIDTADVYAAWVPGQSGGESEAIIGNWMASRRNRDRMVIATKVGMAPKLKGLSPATIRSAAEASLSRLRVPYFSLAKGFLTGKHRPGSTVDSVRAGADARVSRCARPAAAGGARRHRGGPPDDGGGGLTGLAPGATDHVSPVASARTAAQLDELLPAAHLRLTADEVARLGNSGRAI